MIFRTFCRQSKKCKKKVRNWNSPFVLANLYAKKYWIMAKNERINHQGEPHLVHCLLVPAQAAWVACRVVAEVALAAQRWRRVHSLNVRAQLQKSCRIKRAASAAEVMSRQYCSVVQNHWPSGIIDGNRGRVWSLVLTYLWWHSIYWQFWHMRCRLWVFKERTLLDQCVGLWGRWALLDCCVEALIGKCPLNSAPIDWLPTTLLLGDQRVLTGRGCLGWTVLLNNVTILFNHIVLTLHFYAKIVDNYHRVSLVHLNVRLLLVVWQGNDVWKKVLKNVSLNIM